MNLLIMKSESRYDSRSSRTRTCRTDDGKPESIPGRNERWNSDHDWLFCGVVCAWHCDAQCGSFACRRADDEYYEYCLCGRICRNHDDCVSGFSARDCIDDADCQCKIFPDELFSESEGFSGCFDEASVSDQLQYYR